MRNDDLPAAAETSCENFALDSDWPSVRPPLTTGFDRVSGKILEPPALVSSILLETASARHRVLRPPTNAAVRPGLSCFYRIFPCVAVNRQ